MCKIEFSLDNKDNDLLTKLSKIVKEIGNDVPELKKEIAYKVWLEKQKRRVVKNDIVLCR